MATGTPAPAEGDAYHGLREGRIDMPNHLSPDLRELLKMHLHSDPLWRPSAREILRHPLLCGLMRDESIACLRTQPRCPPEMQRTSATLMESDLEPELMVCVHNRALRAEKEAAIRELEGQLEKCHDTTVDAILALPTRRRSRGAWQWS